jgi:SagB-type dehydrogenase family enzyme
MEMDRNFIIKHREITRGTDVDDGCEYASDQQLRRPQPPLVKEKMTGAQIALPMDFSRLKLKNDILDIIYSRESHRVYTGEPMTLIELSFLLWATQGVKSIRGNNYATLRTVPCGGARHEFETYLVVANVEGLKSGAYHYLPLSNELEFLHPIDDIPAKIDPALVGQKWAGKANVIFFWSCVPYRAEWRYAAYGHRVILIDAGHIGQNLYIACEAVGLGTCVLAAYDEALCNALFGLDGMDEYVLYCAPVGKVSPADKEKENAFYAFLKADE